MIVVIAISTGFALFALGVLMVLYAYLILIDSNRTGLDFFTFENLTPAGRKMWTRGMILIVAGFTTTVLSCSTLQ